MLKRALLLQLMLFVGVIYLVAQPKPDTYKTLQSTGEIPKDMIIKSSKKYEVEKSTIDKSETKKNRKSIESFYLSTNFEIDKLLLSGMVSFNDPITVYLNKIVDVLLKDEPALRSQVRVYTMKSTVMNAFATNQGIIVVNIGLLARVKSEAELAFVLAHEITHVEEKHALNKYLKIQTIETDKNVYKGLSLDDKLANVNHYSRELETEADERGLQRYLKAGYSLDAIDASFTSLSYSHTPFADYTFDYKWLESPTFSFPEEFWREKIATVKPQEDDDTTSTHPSIQQRKAHILSKVDSLSNDGKKLNLVSESEFNSVLEFSQFEVCRLHLTRQRYDMAIYEAQALLKKYPNNLYLQKVALKALAAKAHIYFDGIYIGEWEDYINEDIQGNVQRCYHFNLSLATNKEYMASVATRYAWKLKQENPNDKEIETLSDSLMHLLFYKMEVDPEFFSLTARTQSEIDSIALAYNKVKNPDKYRALASISVDTITIDSSILTVRSRSLTVIGDKSKSNDLDLVSISPDTLVTAAPVQSEEPEDTFYVTTVAEAKKLKIKLTGYEKYMLKNKEKYDIMGVRQDGTFVYNEEDNNTASSDSEENGTRRQDITKRTLTDTRNDTLNDRSKRIVVTDSDTAAISAIILEEPYIHDFVKPLDVEFHKYAFVDFADNPTFLKQANEYFKLTEANEDNIVTKAERKKKARDEELNNNRGYALDIDKVVIVNPRYSKINIKNPDKQTYLTSEKKQTRFSNILKKSATASGIQYQLIDNRDLKSEEVGTFNDVAFLNEWLDERLELGATVPFATIELSEREALAQKYGTRYFMWTGNLSIKEKDYMRPFFIAYSSIFPPLLPFVLPKIIRGGKYQIYYYLVYDIISNEMILGDVITVNQLERNDFINSQVYYTFNQLKYKR
jgi:hypothetical protein